MGYQWYIIFHTCVGLIKITVSARSGTYEKEADKRFQSAMVSGKTASTISCCEWCHRTETCSLVSYNRQSRMCELSKFEIGDENKITSESGWNVYYNSENECDTSPCQNSGTCHDYIGNYACTCMEGFVGHSCETALCPTGWHYFNSACYLIVDTDMTWAEAQTHCSNFNSGTGHMISVKTAEENVFMINMLQTVIGREMWLGAHDPDSTNTFEWTDGSLVNDWFNDWTTGEPNNPGSEKCLTVKAFTGNFQWNNLPCTGSKWSMCKYVLT